MCIFTAACFVTLCGCSAGVSRVGYSIDEQRNMSKCNIPIKLKAYFNDGEFDKMGAISIYDYNLISVDCDIAIALGTIKQDACYLGADVINITEEKYPDYVWSVCYRVNADFIKLHDRQQAQNIQSDPQYEWTKIEKEGAISRQIGKAAYWGAVGAGAIGGAVGGAMVGGR